jgi:hypothetical protein
MDDSYFVKVYGRAIDSGLTREEAKRTATKMKFLKKFRADCLRCHRPRTHWPALAATGELSPLAHVERLGELARYADRKAGRSRSPRTVERYEKLAVVYREMAEAVGSA